MIAGIFVEKHSRHKHELSIKMHTRTENKADHNNGPAILAMAGILDDEEASVFDTAIAESRKIDEDER